MRRMLLILLVLIAASAWATDYRVDVATELNVRSQPQANAPLLGKLPNGTILHDAEQAEGGWMKISYEGQEGYVLGKYLSETEETAAMRSTFQAPRMAHTLLDILSRERPKQKWMTFVLLGSILVMWFLCKFVREVGYYDFLSSRHDLKGGLMVMNCLLIIFTSLFACYYIWQTGRSALWFIRPSMALGPWNGWLYAGINFVFFIYAMVSLLVNYAKTLDEFSHIFHRPLNFHFGLAGWIAGCAGLVVCLIAESDTWTLRVLIGLAVWQLIQVAIIFVQGWNGTNILGLLAVSVVYLIGGLGITAIVSTAIIGLLMLIVGCILIWGFMASDDSPSTSPAKISRPIDVYRSGSGDYYYHNEDGNIAYLHNYGIEGGTPLFYDDRGRTFSSGDYIIRE